LGYNYDTNCVPRVAAEGAKNRAFIEYSTSCIATHKIHAGRSASFHAHGINHHAQTEFATFGEILLSPHPAFNDRHN
jgi:hypothetical protein